MEEKNNKKLIERAIKNVLIGIGEDFKREGLKGTPERIARMYEEVFYGLHTEPPELKLFKSNYEGIVKKCFTCFGWCEHHLVPIEFEITFGYIPDGKVTGISKIIRRIKWWTARPSIQENLTKWIVKDFEEEVRPKGIMLIIKGRHFCELIRGVKTDNWTTTSEITGVFKDIDTKEEFLKL